MKFRKKPVVIEAVQWNGEATPELMDLLGNAAFEFLESNPPKLGIWTLEGKMTASVGDWIIRGVKGELYPCRDDIFRATYESVPSSALPWINTYRKDEP